MTAVILDIDDTVKAKFYGGHMAITHGRLDGSLACVVLSPREARLLAQAIQEYYPGEPANLSPVVVL